MSESPTEQPSPQKLRRARREGRVVRSPELTGAAVLLGAVALCGWGGARALAAIRALFADSFEVVRTGAEPLGLLSAASRTLFLALAPVLCGLALLALTAGLIQVGPLWSTRAIEPRLSRLDPLARARGWLSPSALSELAWSALGWVLVVFVSLCAFASAASGVVALPGADAAHALGALSTFGRELLLWVGLVLLVVGVFSIAPRYAALVVSLRMTRREAREEQREQYGDPSVRERRRRLQREAVYQASVAELGNVRLLLVGGDGQVVGLQQPDASSAPLIALCAHDELGRRLLAQAVARGIVTANAPALTRRLARLEIGESVPAESLEAVARLWPRHDAAGPR